MRKNCIINRVKTGGRHVAVIGMFGVLLSVACTGKKSDEPHRDVGLVNIDGDLAHLLKPSNEQVVSVSPMISAEYGTKILMEEAQGVINYDPRNQTRIASRVSGRVERLLIKYNYQPVHKGQLIMEVYAPDLAAAQRELLFLKGAESDQHLLEKAKQRLMLLGMTAEAVNRVLKSGRVNYRIPVYSDAEGYIIEQPSQTVETASSAASSALPAGGMSDMGGSNSDSAPIAVGSSQAASPQSSPVMLREGQYVRAGQSLFTVYNADNLVAEFSLKPALASLIKKGHGFVFHKNEDKSTMRPGVIGMIQPVFKSGSNFTLAKVYLGKSDFRVGELLTARIPVMLSDSWWLPESALVSLGRQTVLFKKEGNVVVPKVVKTGITLDGMVQVKEDISNWEVSKNAAYLVDSESFIKESIKN